MQLAELEFLIVGKGSEMQIFVLSKQDITERNMLSF